MQVIAQNYALRDVVGHEDIAPTRKADPGPAFPLTHVCSLALGRDSAIDTVESVYVAANQLNLRDDPSTDKPPGAAPLLRNTRLVVLDRKSPNWIHVRTGQTPLQEGWVWGAYTARESGHAS